MGKVTDANKALIKLNTCINVLENEMEELSLSDPRRAELETRREALKKDRLELLKTGVPKLSEIDNVLPIQQG